MSIALHRRQNPLKLKSVLMTAPLSLRSGAWLPRSSRTNWAAALLCPITRSGSSAWLRASPKRFMRWDSGRVVVGVTDFTDYPPEAQTKPSVGGLTDASLEKIISLHPDLVLAMAELNRQETVEELEHVGIPVFVVDPQGLQGIMASIQHVGDALNRQRRCGAVVEAPGRTTRRRRRSREGAGRDVRFSS